MGDPDNSMSDRRKATNSSNLSDAVSRCKLPIHWSAPLSAPFNDGRVTTGRPPRPAHERGTRRALGRARWRDRGHSTQHLTEHSALSTIAFRPIQGTRFTPLTRPVSNNAGRRRTPTRPCANDQRAGISHDGWRRTHMRPAPLSRTPPSTADIRYARPAAARAVAPARRRRPGTATGTGSAPETPQCTSLGDLS